MHSQHVQPVTDEDFAARVIEADRPVVVDFWASWCPPCRQMNPIVDELAAEHPELGFVTLDADANARTVIDYGVLSMPTFMVFRDGKEVARFVGSRPKRRFATEIEEALAVPALTQ